MYITKKVENCKKLKNIKTSRQHTVHVHYLFPKFFNFDLNSFIVSLFLIDKGR